MDPCVPSTALNKAGRNNVLLASSTAGRYRQEDQFKASFSACVSYLSAAVIEHRTKSTFRRKGLFGLPIPEGKGPIMAGRQEAWQLDHQAESACLEAQQKAERVKWGW